MIIHLRSLGFTQPELVRLYKTVVRPVAEYCAVVFHSQLTDEQDTMLERLQNHALKLIYGPGISASRMRLLADIPTLRERRISLCDKFSAKAAVSARFCRWFPLRGGRRPTRGALKYEETFARCDRLRNSPIHYMRRRLNGKPGRIYSNITSNFWKQR